MQNRFIYLAATCLLSLSTAALAHDMKILINHLGYEPDAAKRAVITGKPADEITAFRVIDHSSGKEVLTAAPIKVGPVDKWKDWQFWTADLSSLRSQGSFVIECTTNNGPIRSFPFLVQRDLLERNTLSNVIYYFKGQRCSGLLDKADRNLPFQDSASQTADLHGGWYDASGDYGKHLSHLSFSIYFNPQQIPMTDWSLFKAHEQLVRRDASPQKNFRQYKRRLLDEALYGADYLVRVRSPKGSFYRSVRSPGGDKRGADRLVAIEEKSFFKRPVEKRDQLTAAGAKPTSPDFAYEVGYRNGGGVAIAALAVAARCEASGEFSSDRYLQAAKEAFDFLEAHNLEYANDGKENIVDDYCALLAATELFKTTQAPEHKSAADRRAANLMGRLISTGEYADYWRADDGDRPFFHAADAGLPVVCLLSYYDIAEATDQAKLLQVVRKSLETEMRITDEVSNPFGYARQLVQSANGGRRTAFFFPHDAETAPWWQGENARLASLASAARMAAPFFQDDTAFQTKLRTYAWNQLNWILGANPFDACMLQGAGRNNVPYMFFESYEYSNAPGGICNGITGGQSDPHDIELNIGRVGNGKEDNWRWGEQWLPHASWYLLAVSLDH